MPIRANENMISLHGQCTIEEAEALHETARAVEQPVFDLTEATYLHTSIVQVIMASGGAVRGLKPDAVLAACFRQCRPA